MFERALVDGHDALGASDVLGGACPVLSGLALDKDRGVHRLIQDHVGEGPGPLLVEAPRVVHDHGRVGVVVLAGEAERAVLDLDSSHDLQVAVVAVLLPLRGVGALERRAHDHGVAASHEPLRRSSYGAKGPIGSCEQSLWPSFE